MLSATDFLLSLYRLEANNFKYTPNTIGNERGIYAVDEATAFGTVVSIMGRHDCDDTKSIKYAFLKGLGMLTRKEEMEMDPYRNHTPSIYGYDDDL